LGHEIHFILENILDEGEGKNIPTARNIDMDNDFPKTIKFFKWIL
jgi:hypothetical protein